MEKKQSEMRCALHLKSQREREREREKERKREREVKRNGKK